MPTTQPLVKETRLLLNEHDRRAVREGRKTQFRVICKTQPSVTNGADASWRDAQSDLWRNARQYARDCCPYGHVGDHLWVPEPWATVYHDTHDGDAEIGDVPFYRDDYDGDASEVEWLRATHMPNWAARLWLEIVDVRVERIQSISEQGAIAEGCAGSYSPAYVSYGEVVGPDGQTPTEEFRDYWNQRHGPGSWERNDFVWAISFKRLEGAA